MTTSTRRSLALFCVLAALQAVASEPALNVTVVPVYEGMASYAEALAANPAGDRRALWHAKVIAPYWQAYAEGGEYVDYAPSITEPFADIQALRTAAAALRAAAIEPVVRAALQASAAALPGPPVTVCIMAGDSSWSYLRDMHGVGGFTAGAGKIWLTVLPMGDWRDWVAYCTAHEYHHSAWTALHGRNDPIEDMADYLVFEGRADSFARLIEPQRRPPWIEALTPRQEQAAWAITRRHLRATSPELLLGLMFGGAEGTPKWSGYTLGFRIVQGFLALQPDLNVREWTAVDAGDLLRRSAFDDRDIARSRE